MGQSHAFGLNPMQPASPSLSLHTQAPGPTCRCQSSHMRRVRTLAFPIDLWDRLAISSLFSMWTHLLRILRGHAVAVFFMDSPSPWLFKVAPMSKTSTSPLSSKTLGCPLFRTTIATNQAFEALRRLQLRRVHSSPLEPLKLQFRFR